MSYKVTDIKIDKNNVNFKLYTTDCQSVNLFRQTMLSYIPTFAIDTVNVYENTSSYVDEYISHRLALIPLKYHDIDEKDVEFELKIYAKSTMYNVTTKDLKSNCKIVPIDDDILICKLFPGQYLHIKAYIKKDIGENHAKWSPITFISFKEIMSKEYYIETETIGMISAEDLIKNTLNILAK